jgi:hypothetical protein
VIYATVGFIVLVQTEYDTQKLKKCNHCRRLLGFKHLSDVIRGVKFENGVRTDIEASSRIAAAMVIAVRK